MNKIRRGDVIIMEHIDTALMAAFFFTPPAERGGDRHGN